MNTESTSRETNSRTTENDSVYRNETIVIQELTRTLREVMTLQVEAHRSYTNISNSVIGMLSSTMNRFYNLRDNTTNNNAQNTSRTRDRTTDRSTNWFMPQNARPLFSTPVTNVRTSRHPTSRMQRYRNNRNRDNHARRQNLLNRTLNPSRSVPRVDFTNRVFRGENDITNTGTNRFFENFINSTLHNATYPNYTLSRDDINRSITTQLWSDISGTTDQTVCPIIQTQFSDTDMVSRLINCGHIFSTAAINNYLLNYDNRCPVCRRNVLLSESDNVRTGNQTSTPTETVSSSGLPQNNLLTPQNIISDEVVNNISNTLVNEITNSLFPNTNTNTNTNTTPSQISAEYSFYFPTNTRPVTQRNETNITNTSTSNPRTFYWDRDEDGSRGWTERADNSEPTRYVTTYETTTTSNTSQEEITQDNSESTHEEGETKEDDDEINSESGEINENFEENNDTTTSQHK